LSKIIECVPNFSEGTDQTKINSIVSSIKSIQGVTILDCDPGLDTNRTVVTFVGEPESVIEAAFQGIKCASELIDMSQHKGTHPRIGATDVCPIIPVNGVSIEECIKYSIILAKKVGLELNIPVYLYEKSAIFPSRENLASIREGEYEGLEQKLKDKNWSPDFGPTIFNKSAGATVIGCREFLIAYNINLNTTDKRLATDIAFEIREAGRSKRKKNPKSSNLLDGEIIRHKNGSPIKVPGKFKYVKAIGWYVSEYNRAQISINFTNYKISPIHQVFDAVCDLASKRGLRVTGSELIGLIPKSALVDAGKYYLKKQGRSLGISESDILECAVQSLGLDDVSEFILKEKIIEFAIEDKKDSLLHLSTDDIIHSISQNSPAPGGGSVSALSGALGAALLSMVALLTYDKKEYLSRRAKMSHLGEMAHKYQKRLKELIDEDTFAFDSVMDASRLPGKTKLEIKLKKQELFKAYKIATDTALEIAFTSLEIMKLSIDLIKFGNSNSVTDAHVAAEVGLAGVRGGCVNVMINLLSFDKISDYNLNIEEKIEGLLKDSNRLHKEAFTLTKKIIKE
tara:strand:+ start:489 stop:2192 length:1704 start_codon:yes stop_codon:yes gene_type:complete